jgi:hypothetical protein
MKIHGLKNDVQRGTRRNRRDLSFTPRHDSGRHEVQDIQPQRTRRTQRRDGARRMLSAFHPARALVLGSLCPRCPLWFRPVIPIAANTVKCSSCFRVFVATHLVRLKPDTTYLGGSAVSASSAMGPPARQPRWGPRLIVWHLQRSRVRRSDSVRRVTGGPCLL